MQKNKPVKFTEFLFLVCLVAALAGRTAGADNLGDAQRLLRITAVGEHFELTAKRQTAEIVRTYSSIVNNSAGVILPNAIKQQITSCYAQAYAWENFEAGIAQIFADSLSQAELHILIDFFSDRSVPPPRITLFRELREKARSIEQLSIDYMLSSSDGCGEQNVALIMAYLAGQGS